MLDFFSNNLWEVFFWLMVGHAIADFALQSDWMVTFKSRHNKVPPEYSNRPDLVWVHVLTSHALLHGGAVALATGNVWLGVAETVAHWIIDFGKCENWFGFHTDQVLHIACKFVWLLFLI